jgi:hypothetical protein
MKYPKRFGVPLMFIAIGVVVAVTVAGFVIQKRAAGERNREAAQQAITASDATDTKLDKDFSDIDTSMNAINVDAASIDAGVNDKMGDLSE